MPRNVVTALRTAGFTLDYDSGGHGSYTAHKGLMWIHEGISASGDYSQTIAIAKAVQQLMVADATALIGTNDTEEGRALNRRVELVKQ